MYLSIDYIIRTEVFFFQGFQKLASENATIEWTHSLRKFPFYRVNTLSYFVVIKTV